MGNYDERKKRACEIIAAALTLRAVAEECRRRQVEQTQMCIDNPTLTGKCVRCGRSESYGDFATDLCKLASEKGGKP